MRASTLTISSYGLSDIGRRKNNEDALKELSSPPFFALADGMGGHPSGEVAAKEAVLYLCDLFSSNFLEHALLSLEESEAFLAELFVDTNHWVRSLAKDHPELKGMGTTLCAGCILANTFLYGNLGDSRIYLFRDKTLTQLTKDHSLRQELIEEGESNEEKLSSVKNIITRAIGISDKVNPDIHKITLVPDDLLLFCTDGLSDGLDKEAIVSILSSTHPLRELAANLIDEAKQAGSMDNISVILVQIESSFI